MHAKIAWRNIWRNKRRTLVILMAVIIGVWSMIFLGALMRGMETEMIRDGVATLTGSIQIHHPGYLNDPVVENSMTDSDALEDVLKRVLPAGSRWTRRVRVNVVASNARHSSGVTMVGILPDKEKEVSFIGKSVTEGRYFKETDGNKIIVGRALLQQFGTRIGNKLILMGQDTNNEVASKAFRIVGSYQASLETVEKQFVFVPIGEAAGMLKLDREISEIAVLLPQLDIHAGKEAEAADRIKAEVDSGKYDIRTWKELLPLMKAYVDMSDFFLYIWYFVVFIAMGFGIVNTTLMAIFERMREFGLAKALGMKPGQIIFGVLTESFFLLLIGITIGNLAGLLSVAVIAEKGIDLSALAAGAEMWSMPKILYPEIWVRDVAVAALVVFGLGLLVTLYPAVKAARFTPADAMRKT